ncbi:MAG: hypothetical protein COX29_03700 [Candidatus Moranbacteria bacterium CG23_combo_of_CG06-09_8_20_14_all_35_22]|nr:MAG: hypothetical protein COX29_03700 [Candidatus Moranbacteria bacterium CG23_combo_of_CG06-09_8_20_14_all_35_22]
MNSKVKDFWQKYEYKIVLAVGFVLVAVVSFEGGILKGQKLSQNPVIIEKSIENAVPIENNINSAVQGVSQSQNLPTEVKNKDCALVGSKNSNKYHLPTCRYAKSIKPENRVCFSSEDDAKSKGYLPDKNCIK